MKGKPSSFHHWAGADAIADERQYSITAPAPQGGYAVGIGFGIFTAEARRAQLIGRWFKPVKTFESFKTIKMGGSDTTV